MQTLGSKQTIKHESTMSLSKEVTAAHTQTHAAYSGFPLSITALCQLFTPESIKMS